MTVTFYPKGLLVTFVFLVMFGATLSLAVDVLNGVAAAGGLAALAYLLVEVVGTVSVAAWWRPWRQATRIHKQ